MNHHNGNYLPINTLIYNYSLKGENISVILNGTNTEHNNEDYNEILYKKYEKYFRFC